MRMKQLILLEVGFQRMEKNGKIVCLFGMVEYMINKYILLATTDASDNIEILNMSDDIEELKKDWDNIDILMQERTEMKDGYSKLSDVSKQMLEVLSHIPLLDDYTHYLKEIQIEGIFQTKFINCKEKFEGKR